MTKVAGFDSSDLCFRYPNEQNERMEISGEQSGSIARRIMSFNNVFAPDMTSKKKKKRKCQMG